MKTTKIILPLLLLALLPAPTVEAAAEAPAVSAASAVLMDADTGRILWEKNGNEPRLIASTTKIMTALVALENNDPDRSVTVDPSWTGIEGSSMYLSPGQELTVRDLLYGLMLASGNDAAAALACITAGSEEEFAALMNRRAEALGCTDTHFENPSGLDGAAHYASARDLAIITREALGNETFREIVSTRVRTIGDLTYTNHNRLLRECEGVFGVKTGYTQAAGRTLVSCCERDGVTLICVTLSDPDDWSDHRNLFAWGFGRYVREDALPSNASWFIPVIGGCREAVPVALSEPLTISHCADEPLRVVVRLPSFVYAAVRSGETAGEAVVYVDGAEADRAELIYSIDVDKAPEEQTKAMWERLRWYPGSGERTVRL